MPFIILIILPILDIYLALSWLFDAPTFALIYFAITMGIGAFLIKLAKVGVKEVFRLLSTQAVSPLAAIGFIKLWIIGAFLFFPGYISDILALIIWWLPFKVAHRPDSSPPQTQQPLEVEAEIIETHDRDSG